MSSFFYFCVIYLMTLRVRNDGCISTKSLLTEKGIAFEEIVLGRDATSRSLNAITGRATVPQVFIDGQHIGGSEQLAEHLA